jgi:hypothetical protein
MPLKALKNQTINVHELVAIQTETNESIKEQNNMEVTNNPINIEISGNNNM